MSAIIHETQAAVSWEEVLQELSEGGGVIEYLSGHDVFYGPVIRIAIADDKVEIMILFWAMQDEEGITWHHDSQKPFSFAKEGSVLSRLTDGGVSFRAAVGYREHTLYPKGHPKCWSFEGVARPIETSPLVAEAA